LEIIIRLSKKGGLPAIGQTRFVAVNLRIAKPGVFAMSPNKLRIERRQQKRFKVEEGAFAALVNHTSKLGLIKDISRLGLSFHYIEDHDRDDAERELKIILGEYGLFMDKVPYKTVDDFEIESEFRFSSIKMRQINLAFGELTPEQQTRLDDIIRNHTVREV